MVRKLLSALTRIRKQSRVPIVMLSGRCDVLERVTGWSLEPTTTWSSRLAQGS
jgi:DNA-binding response OmpR family regulator